MAKTKHPKRKMVLAAYNRKKILPRYPVNLKLYREKIGKFKMVQEIQAILSFTIFVKNSKIQNGRHFWKEEEFLKIEQSILHIYPVGQKFRRNRSISHVLGDTSNFKFYHFCQKFENSKWLPFLDRGKFFFEKCAEYLA